MYELLISRYNSIESLSMHVANNLQIGQKTMDANWYCDDDGEMQVVRAKKFGKLTNFFPVHHWQASIRRE